MSVPVMPIERAQLVALVRDAAERLPFEADREAAIDFAQHALFVAAGDWYIHRPGGTRCQCPAMGAGLWPGQYADDPVWDFAARFDELLNLEGDQLILRVVDL